MSFTCPLCSNQYDKLISLSLHFRGNHKKTAKELYTAMHCEGIEPACKCGCGEPVRFMDITRGFSDFAPGHQSRVKNNFQTEKSKANSLKTRRKMLETGDWKPFVNNETGKHWKDGLTAETDSRVAKQRAAILENPEERKRRSEMMKECWKDGRIQTKTGPEHSQWNGGTSPLLSVCHGNRRFFQLWKYPKLLAADFTCQECKNQNKKGNPVNLHVHHDKAKMATIVRLIAESFGWQDFYGKTPNDLERGNELKSKISEAVADYHIQNNVSGIVLCEVCHSNLHDKMNF